MTGEAVQLDHRRTAKSSIVTFYGQAREQVSENARYRLKRETQSCLKTEQSGCCRIKLMNCTSKIDYLEVTGADGCPVYGTSGLPG